MSNRLYNQFAYSPERQPVHLMGKFTQTVANVQATLVNQGVTYTAVARGTTGNSVTITLVNPGSDGALSIAVVGNAITATLAYATGAVTTTAAQLITAINGNAPAAALVVASGAGASPLTALTATPLAGGIDAVLTDTAMRMSMTQSATGTYVLSLEDEFPNLLACNMSLQTASAANQTPQIVSAATAYGTAKQIVIRIIKLTDQSLSSLAVNDSIYIHLILRNSSNP
jgi:hypothetical protein